jgi:hypothetical protein
MLISIWIPDAITIGIVEFVIYSKSGFFGRSLWNDFLMLCFIDGLRYSVSLVCGIIHWLLDVHQV